MQLGLSAVRIILLRFMTGKASASNVGHSAQCLAAQHLELVLQGCPVSAGPFRGTRVGRGVASHKHRSAFQLFKVCCSYCV